MKRRTLASAPSRLSIISGGQRESICFFRRHRARTGRRRGLVRQFAAVAAPLNSSITVRVLKALYRSLNRWYFNPRPWERYNGGAVYAWLGVRIYKKYLPTSGDLVTRARGIKRLKVGKLGRRAALEAHSKQTRVWEWRHLVSAVLLQAWAVFAGIEYGMEDFWIPTGINVVVNIYPIMLQRFNRVRIDACLGNMKFGQRLRQTRKSPSSA